MNGRQVEIECVMTRMQRMRGTITATMLSGLSVKSFPALSGNQEIDLVGEFI